MSDNKYNKFYYSILCAVIGDIIGYENGGMEFNSGYDLIIKSQKDMITYSGISVYHVVNFVAVGGLSKYDPTDNIVSDDSILLLATLDALIESYNKENDEILNTIKNYLLKYFVEDEIKDDRNYGYRTVKGLERINDGLDWNKWAYSDHAGGSGASMRNMAIGLIYHGKKNREKLIYLGLNSGRITHNNAIGYLGGLASALFAAFAIEEIDPNKWMFELLTILHSEYFKKLIAEITTVFPGDKEKHETDIKLCISWLKAYVGDRFDNGKFNDVTNDEDHIAINMRFFDLRSQYYYENFNKKEFKKEMNPGANGIDSVIIAYDSFMDSHSFQSLVMYSMLHVGDSDTTGCIAGSLYGAYHGKKTDIQFDYTKIDKFEMTTKLIEKAKFIFS